MTTDAKHDAVARSVATFADLQQVVSKTVWLWPGHIPRGHVTLIAGDPGIGKSLLALDLARRCLDGGEWPDRAPCERLESVMIADTEGTQAVTMDRLVHLGIALDRVLLPLAEPLGDLRLDDRKSWDAFSKRVTEARPGLVIIDSLCGSNGGDEDRSRDMTDVLGKLQRLARDTQAAIIVIHHTRKRSETWAPLALDHVRGSSAITANARAVFGIEPADPNDGGGMRRLKMLKSNLGTLCDPLGFVIDEERVEWVPLPEAAEVASGIEKAIAFLREALGGGPVAANEMHTRAAAIGVSWSTAQRAKRKIGVKSEKQTGAQDSGWVWMLPPALKAAGA